MFRHEEGGKLGWLRTKENAALVMRRRLRLVFRYFLAIGICKNLGVIPPTGTPDLPPMGSFVFAIASILRVLLSAMIESKPTC